MNGAARLKGQDHVVQDDFRRIAFLFQHVGNDFGVVLNHPNHVIMGRLALRKLVRKSLRQRFALLTKRHLFVGGLGLWKP